MLRMNKGTIILTGIGAYLIARKGIRVISHAVDKISDTVKWNSYYKAIIRADAKDKNDILPPGYSSTASYSDGHTVTLDPSGKSVEQREQQIENGTKIADAIKKTVDGIFDHGCESESHDDENGYVDNVVQMPENVQTVEDEKGEEE